VTERITRYPTSDDARSLLDGLVESDRIGDTPDRHRIGYDNRIADKQVMQCAYHRPPPNSPIRDGAFCQVYAQYGAYVVQVAGYIDDHTMSYADFERLLQAVDAKMTIITNEHAAQHAHATDHLRHARSSLFEAVLYSAPTSAADGHDVRLTLPSASDLRWTPTKYSHCYASHVR